MKKKSHESIKKTKAKKFSVNGDSMLNNVNSRDISKFKKVSVSTPGPIACQMPIGRARETKPMRHAQVFWCTHSVL